MSDAAERAAKLAEKKLSPSIELDEDRRRRADQDNPSPASYTGNGARESAE